MKPTAIKTICARFAEAALYGLSIAGGIRVAKSSPFEGVVYIAVGVIGLKGLFTRVTTHISSPEKSEFAINYEKRHGKPLAPR